MAKTNVARKFIDDGFGGSDWYSWDETCDRCGCLIRGKETISNKEPITTEADFCSSCIGYLKRNNITYPEARMIYKINVRELNDKYLKEMDTLHNNEDVEFAHGAADKILCNMLNELGYVDIVESFNKVKKYYS